MTSLKSAACFAVAAFLTLFAAADKIITPLQAVWLIVGIIALCAIANIIVFANERKE